MGVIYKNGNYYGGGGGASYTAGDGIDITNDVISTDNMQSGDMDDVISPLPSLPVKYPQVYSTTEQVVGQWIDSKPLYQKTFNITLTQKNTWVVVESNFSCVIVSQVNTKPNDYYAGSNDFSSLIVKVESNQLKVYLASPYPGSIDVTFTLQYTKTT